MSIRKITHALTLSLLFLSLPVMLSAEIKHLLGGVSDDAGVELLDGVSEDQVREASEGTKSAKEIAKELANPNTSLASLAFKNRFKVFTGDLPDANDQTSTITLFQPVFPFRLESGDQIIWRPAIPITWDSPSGRNFRSESGIGDFSFDLVYAPKSVDHIVTAIGIVSTWSTATNSNLGIDKWTVGPDFLYGKVTDEYVFGMHPAHQWSVAGSKNAKDISMSSSQFFALSLFGDGWLFGTNPTITYDWNEAQWEIPLNVILSKTMVIDKRPWKFGVEVNYYVDKNKDFGPKWMFAINITPVIENPLTDIFK